MYVRKLKKYENDDSLDRLINEVEYGDKIRIIDTISDDVNIIEDYIDNEVLLNIREIVNNLQGREKNIIMLYFGFYNGRLYNQKEIAKIYGISQAYISRFILNVVSQVGEQLAKKKLIEYKKPKAKVRKKRVINKIG